MTYSNIPANIAVINYKWEAVWRPLVHSPMMINDGHVTMKSMAPL